MKRKEKIEFEDLLNMIEDKQIDIAQKLDLSRQMISDLKFNRRQMSLTTLSKFVNEYPDLPWLEYIKDIIK